MSTRALLIEVRFADGRYHGADDWPPSPFRLFQALVAGAYGGRWAGEPPEYKDAAFQWLESLELPHIAVPPTRTGAAISLYVPNNDLDAHGGDPRRMSEIRVKKRLSPRIFDRDASIFYAWPFVEGEQHATTISALAERLHTLGLGVDGAHARGEIATWDEAETRLTEHGGLIVRPGGGDSHGATCPTGGSLESLKQRHLASAQRFRPGEKDIQFVNAPKPRFRQVAYNSRPPRLLFDLFDHEGRSWPYRIDRIAELTEKLRDAASRRLETASSGNALQIRSVVVGSRASSEADKAARIRVTPLPSIGYRHADRAIRRVLVEAPPNCPLPVSDITWAFSGLPVSSGDGEILCELTAGAETGQLAHYGLESSARCWRTVTPAALPQNAARRRIDPERMRDRTEQKAGLERAREESQAAAAVRQALRHVGVMDKVETIRVQREPFEARGTRADAFAVSSRFPKERLWHVEIVFADGRKGPMILGDGRYLGLGLMAPIRSELDAIAMFDVSIEAQIAGANRAAFLHAARRALMALARRADGSVLTLFSGHESDGRKAASGRHRHVFLAAADLDSDGFIDKLMVAAPWACDRSASPRDAEKTEFDRVVSQLSTVRAGELGVIALNPVHSGECDSPLIGHSRVWESVIPYQPTRYAKRGEDKAEAGARDAIAECLRRGLPRPDVEVIEFAAGPNGGNCAIQLRLRFAVAVEGPVLIGRDSHAGGGLFRATPS